MNLVLNLLSTFLHALRLSAVCLVWVWSTALRQTVGWPCTDTLHFTRCWHCNARWSRPDMVYCQRCLVELQAEYAAWMAQEENQ